MKPTLNKSTWITLSEGAAIVECSYSQARTIFTAAKIRTRKLPGQTRTMYQRGDLQRLAAELAGAPEPAFERISA